jgi:addiction module HigA family antidote
MGRKDKRLKPVHPGDLLSRIMKEMDISSYALAKATGKTPTQIHRIANGKASMTADMARLIGMALGTSAEMWVRLQAQYDLEVAEIKNPDLEVTQIVDAGQKVA